MSTDKIQFNTRVTLEQAAKIIMATPQNVYLLRGAPGIGKTSLIEYISEQTGYEKVYVDVPNMDLGDIGIPFPNREKRVTEYLPNSRFKLHEGKPVVIFLDEYTKGVDPVKNMLHPLIEQSNPRLGDVPVPKGSIIVMTGNLTSDGVGDNLKAHSRNRIIELHIDNPSAEQWLRWAVNRGVHEVVLAWVDQYPHCMASYLDEGNEDNPYCYNPKKVQKACVTPRSLVLASNVLHGRDMLDSHSVMAALAGAIGEAAARDMQAFIEYHDQLVPFKDIVKDPKGARLPKSAAACSVMAFGAIQKITKDTLDPFMEYLERLQPEWQACFALSLAKTPNKQAIAFSSARFTKWVHEYEYLI